MKLLLLSILTLLHVANASQAQVRLSNKSKYTLKGNIYIFKEAADKIIPIKEAFKYYDQHKFNHLFFQDDNLNLGFTDRVYWLAIPLQNISNKTVELEGGITNQGIYHLESYFVLYPSGQLISKNITGKNHDFYTRKIPCRHYYLPFALDPNQQAIIFYRIDMRGNNFYTPLCMVTTKYRQESEVKNYFSYAFFSGFLTFVSFFSLVTFVWTKDKVYLFYCLYVASCCLLFLADGDLDFEWLYPHWPAWATIAPSMYASSIVLFMLLFMNDFLELKVAHPKLFTTSRIFALFIISVMILIPIGFDVYENMALRKFIYNYGYCCLVAGWTLQIFCIVRRILDRYKPAYLYGVAIICVFIAAAIYFLHSFNLVATADVSFNYLLIGFTTEIFVLSFALIYSFTFHKKKHRQLSESMAMQQLAFSHQLLQVQEAEKKRIAEDLHDELGGNLAAIKMNLQSLQIPNGNAAKIISLIDSASNNARSIAHNLMPPEFAKIKLKDLLQNYFTLINTESKIKFHYYTTGEDGHFNKDDDLIIYRIIMELSNNITKHSKATEATIQLIYYDLCLEVMCEDNGIGFTNDSGIGIGMKNIQSRVSYLNGKINIDSSQHGTAIIIKIPYKNSNGKGKN